MVSWLLPGILNLVYTNVNVIMHCSVVAYFDAPAVPLVRSALALVR